MTGIHDAAGGDTTALLRASPPMTMGRWTKHPGFVRIRWIVAHASRDGIRDVRITLQAGSGTPHVAQNTSHSRSAIDERATRYAGYKASHR